MPLLITTNINVRPSLCSVKKPVNSEKKVLTFGSCHDTIIKHRTCWCSSVGRAADL